MTAPKIIALTMGDPAGIGLDLTATIWSQRTTNACPPFLFYGDAEALRSRASALGIKLPIECVGDATDAISVFDTRLPVMPVRLASRAAAGQTDTANAPAIIASIEQAVAACASNNAVAVVTNPIAKATLYGAGFKHPGHTEFLAALAAQHSSGWNSRPVMMLTADELSVVPVTVHIPLKDVATALTQELIVETAHILIEALLRDFGKTSPRIAVAGLNPHAGESGTMGREDADIIAPAIEKLCAQGHCVTGPWPADTMFHARARTTYDAVMAMYHDQALIPIKTLAFDRGVNVTLGLPFVRTSPDHGTAFDIAGSGKADAASLLAAMKLAVEMGARRAMHKRQGDGVDGGEGGGARATGSIS